MKRAKPEFNHSNLFKKEDWWACWIGFIILTLCALGVIGGMYKVPKMATWGADPMKAFSGQTLLSYLIMFIGLVIIYLIALKVIGNKVKTFIPAFAIVFLIALRLRCL